ncbi:MAG: GNAT family N-acetyltransferase [Eubacterium sp.]
MDNVLKAKSKIENREVCFENKCVRHLVSDELQNAIDLIWEVFLQFEAPEYSQEGINYFRASLDDKERIRALNWYGAFDNENLVGVLTMRAPQHIGGFFVKTNCQGKGFGRMLFEAMKADYEKQEFTVNSSPYAVQIYEHLGFVATDTEQTVNGIRFTPMKYKN